MSAELAAMTVSTRASGGVAASSRCPARISTATGWLGPSASPSAASVCRRSRCLSGSACRPHPRPESRVASAFPAVMPARQPNGAPGHGVVIDERVAPEHRRVIVGLTERVRQLEAVGVGRTAGDRRPRGGLRHVDDEQGGAGRIGGGRGDDRAPPIAGRALLARARRPEVEQRRLGALEHPRARGHRGAGLPPPGPTAAAEAGSPQAAAAGAAGVGLGRGAAAASHASNDEQNRDRDRGVP